MIDFQSPTIAKRPNHRPCHSPSPGGSNERSECRFVCCSDVGRGEGELNPCGRPSALMLCPSGTFENSQQHARVIYGWVHGFHQAKVPQGRQKSVFIRLCASNSPLDECRFMCCSKLSFGEGGAVKVSQGHSRLLKPIQGILEKRIVYFTGGVRRRPPWWATCPATESRSR
jgi:hypothetical protein